MLQYILTGTVYLLCMKNDIQKKRISKKMIWIYLLLALAGRAAAYLWGSEDLTAAGVGLLKDVSLSVIPGAVSLSLSWMTREAFGYGDSFLILGCGISLGAEACMQLILWAFFFSALWSLGLLIMRRADRKQEIPFVPFLLLGWVITVLQMAAG